MFKFLRTAITFFTVAEPLYLPNSTAEGSNFSTASLTLVFFFFF